MTEDQLGPRRRDEQEERRQQETIKVISSSVDKMKGKATTISEAGYKRT
jgi:hypothetical protein